MTLANFLGLPVEEGPSSLAVRQPARVSCLFGSQRLNRLYGSGAARWDEAGQDANQGQAGRNASQQQEVVASVHFYNRC